MEKIIYILATQISSVMYPSRCLGLFLLWFWFIFYTLEHF